MFSAGGNRSELAPPSPCRVAGILGSGRLIMTVPHEEEMRRGPMQAAQLELSVVLEAVRLPAGLAVLLLLLGGGDIYIAAAVVVMLAVSLLSLLPSTVRMREAAIGEARLAEPIAASLYRLTVFAALLANGWFPAWALIVLFGRDLVVPYVRASVRQHGQDMSARGSDVLMAGVHALAQAGIAAASLGVWGEVQWLAAAVSHLLVVAATMASLWSVIDHVGEAMRLVRP
jgi:hypothetical protein